MLSTICLLSVLSNLSVITSCSHVCLRAETKELLFQATRVGTDEKELIFPVTSNYLSIHNYHVIPRFVDSSDIK